MRDCRFAGKSRRTSSASAKAAAAMTRPAPGLIWEASRPLSGSAYWHSAAVHTGCTPEAGPGHCRAAPRLLARARTAHPLGHSRWQRRSPHRIASHSRRLARPGPLLQEPGRCQCERSCRDAEQKPLAIQQVCLSALQKHLNVRHCEKETLQSFNKQMQRYSAAHIDYLLSSACRPP